MSADPATSTKPLAEPASAAHPRDPAAGWSSQAAATADGPPTDAGSRRRLPAAAPALLAYVLLRAAGLIVLWIFSHRAGADFWWLLHSRYDSTWYAQIADQGYDQSLDNVGPDGKSRLPNLPFFPLYPGLTAGVAAVTPFSIPVAALVVSWVAGIAAAWGIYAVGVQLASRRVGLLLVVLWAVLPHAVVQNMAYTETLFTALVAWTLYALLRRRWLTAGVLCLVAGFSRPTASALIAAVGVAALVAVARRQDGWRPWVAGLLAPLGYLGYLAWIGQRLGRVDAYFHMQSTTWKIGFDGGVDTFATFRQVLTEAVPLSFYTSTLLMAIAAVLVVLLVLDRYPLPVVVYSLTFLILTVGTEEYYWAKGRYLVPAFTLLLPVALALGKARPRTRILVLGLLALISAWYGTYLSLIWTASP
ncbi:glycosyltransferase family 39 protein [Micromonospora endolithica]|uniref:Uncharacterized protein n=1 Tax=Micromonospora endolithica TaxID=230091 RepID=A0A3A9ZAW6_9ACTN|nr:glycosyltransferase family 39 protein [Micromonospora endolithica]RKN45453.1 hypothetical protein D7223_17825 [Micromonospora endolithica]TWJ22822.1 dolichyl-phosphate-mannose-protein mannosyltransferase [Micromonospora endolithica]